MKTRTGIGQDSHRFLPPETSKPCILAGLIFEGTPGVNSNSDGDVVFHSLCNAITSLTGVVILGGIADDLCHKDGITDSEVYLKEAMKTLGKQKISHVAITIEAKKTKNQATNHRHAAEYCARYGLRHQRCGHHSYLRRGAYRFWLWRRDTSLCYYNNAGIKNNPRNGNWVNIKHSRF